jgi:GWxTD domain-containing protein
MKYLLMLLLLTTSLIAQVEYSSRRSGIPIFNYTVDYASFKSNQANKTRVDFFVQVPYSSIQFVKKDNAFSGGYSVTLSFMDDSKKNILFERNWREKLSTKDFNQTISRDNFNLSYKSFDVNPGKYFVKSIVEDSDSRQTSVKEFQLEVRKLNDSLAISDFIFISEIVKDSTGEKIVPNVSRLVTNKTVNLPFFYEIYSDREHQVHVEYYLNDKKRNLVTKLLDPIKVKKGVNLITHTIDKSDFVLGDYSLKIELKDSAWNPIDLTEKSFNSIIWGIPTTITDLDKAVKQMTYIASGKDIDFILEGESYDEKLNRFFAFWDTKKPNQTLDDNPILYEYYRRIEYANKNFKGMLEGWRSDMGLIYVTFGPPSSVERHPMEIDSKPYEVWDYYELNRYFVFVDQTGFGDYRLLNPDYSRWPGYRP